MSHNFHPTILREYDIRGIVGDTLHEPDAYHTGLAFGSIARERVERPRICVGYDGRLSSISLSNQVIRGLRDAGVDVIAIGLGPTPMLYFSVHYLKSDGGIMITGSHNPPTHNGFKMMMGTDSFFGADIKKLGEMATSGKFAEGSGNVTEQDVSEPYLAALLNACKPSTNTLRIGWDPGNGSAGEIVSRLTKKLPGEHFLINETIDGTFPAHHPDPTVPKNLEQLIELVRANNLDCGLAFDGDGDRLGVVDSEGNILWGDQLVLLYAAEIVKTHPGATIIGDVKASRALFAGLKSLGAKPLMWKTGHSLIKTKMKETKAPLAGEMSGHLFFADEYFGFDDGVYAAVRFVNLLMQERRNLKQLVNALPRFVNTPEMRLDCPDERKFAVIDEVKARLNEDGVIFNDVDGVRVETPNGWWLLRASNTGGHLIARAEAKDSDGLTLLTAELNKQLKLSGLKETTKSAA